jgi:phosphatidylserine decarboxylase
MKIHPEGYRIIQVAFTFLTSLNVVVALAFPKWWLFLLIPSIVLFLVVVQFFRIKMRIPQNKDPKSQVLAPADGQVVVIEEVHEPEYFREKRWQVSIFMSLFNMHVNTAPVEGKVVYFKHHPGRYLAAWHPKSSLENERTTVVLENKQGKLLLRQIAGAVARQIRNRFQAGDQVQQGQELGFIRFGSRVDILLPLDAKIQVSIGDRVRFNQTVLAELAAKTAD